MKLSRNLKFYLLNTLFWLVFGIYRTLPGYLAGFDDFYPWDYISIICGLGVFISSTYRAVLKKLNFDYTNIQRSFLVIAAGCVVSLIIYQIIVLNIDPVFVKELNEIKEKAHSSVIALHLAIVVENLVEILPWFLVFHFYKYIQTQHELKSQFLEQEKLVQHLQYENMVAKLNPHFMFNTLNTIRWLAKSNSEHTRAALDKLSNVLRYNMSSNSVKRTFNDELDIVKQYLEIEKLRFDERLNFTIFADEQIKNKPIIPFILLNTVENAIKHGISKVTLNGQVDIAIKQEGNSIKINVKNSGRLDGLNKGFGLKSIEALLNNYSPHSEAVLISELPGPYVTVNITHPLNAY